MSRVNGRTLIYFHTVAVFYQQSCLLKAGDVLYKTDSQETYTVSKRATLIGVAQEGKTCRIAARYR